MGVDEFVAELGEKELRILLAHIVEIFAYLGIQANPNVIVDGEFAVVL